MMSVGRAVEYERCQKSKLFENEKPSFMLTRTDAGVR